LAESSAAESGKLKAGQWVELMAERMGVLLGALLAADLAYD